jgi:hypothetical protein
VIDSKGFLKRCVDGDKAGICTGKCTHRPPRIAFITRRTAIENFPRKFRTNATITNPRFCSLRAGDLGAPVPGEKNGEIPNSERALNGRQIKTVLQVK